MRDSLCASVIVGCKVQVCGGENISISILKLKLHQQTVSENKDLTALEQTTSFCWVEQQRLSFVMWGSVFKLLEVHSVDAFIFVSLLVSLSKVSPMYCLPHRDGFIHMLMCSNNASVWHNKLNSSAARANSWMRLCGSVKQEVTAAGTNGHESAKLEASSWGQTTAGLLLILYSSQSDKYLNQF